MLQLSKETECGRVKRIQILGDWFPNTYVHENAFLPDLTGGLNSFLSGPPLEAQAYGDVDSTSSTRVGQIV